jgi:hypothetical protein
MITGVTTGKTGGYLYVDGSYSSLPNVYSNPNNPLQGIVRYMSNTNRFEVFDGTSWIPVTPGMPAVSLSNEAIDILNWAKQKMTDEHLLAELAKTNPGVADAIDNLKKAQEQVDIMVTLVKEST